MLLQKAAMYHQKSYKQHILHDSKGRALNSYNNFSGFMVWALGQNPSTIDAVNFGKQIAEFYPINNK